MWSVVPKAVLSYDNIRFWILQDIVKTYLRSVSDYKDTYICNYTLTCELRRL